MKKVSEAHVKVVSLRELNVGDYILWSNLKRKVVDIDYQNRKIKLNTPYDENLIEEFNSYNTYYKIIECTEEYIKATCPGCGKLIDCIDNGLFDFCTPECKDKYEKEIKEDYSIYGM